MVIPLGALIRSAREERGWTLTELSRQAQVDHALVSRIESGQRTGSPATLHRLALALELDPADVLAAAAQRVDTSSSDQAA